MSATLTKPAVKSAPDTTNSTQHDAETANTPVRSVPNTVSPEAQQFIANGRPGVLPMNFKDNLTAVQELRRFAASSNKVNSDKAVQQYLESTESSTLAGVPVVWGTPKGYNKAAAGDKVIMFLHGGGYVFSSCQDQWNMVALAAQASGFRVLSVEYRLAPENPFPAGLNDVLAVYKGLTSTTSGSNGSNGQQGGSRTYDPKHIAVLGDSAGGGLALAMLIQLQREGLPMPGALVLFSPWVDVEKRGDTLTTLAAADPAISYDGFKPLAYAYVAGDEAKFSDPLVSPLRADYAALFSNNTYPPTLFQLGTRDSLLSGSVMLYRKLKAAGQTGIVFSPWEAMWHDFQKFLHMPEAREAQQEAAQFIARCLRGSCSKQQLCVI